jgi:hypothetical protein
LSLDREALKRVALEILNEIGSAHPIGHQPVKVARYVIAVPRGKGAEIEVMFEKDPADPPHFWITEEAAGILAGGSIKQTKYPSGDLRKERGKDGTPLYGRHSALEKMPQLGEADLIRFTPDNVSELGAIIGQIVAASIAGLR